MQARILSQENNPAISGECRDGMPPLPAYIGTSATGELPSSLLADGHSELLNAITSPVVLIDNQGDIWAVNDAWRLLVRVCGFLDARAGVGKSYVSVLEHLNGHGAAQGAELAQISEGITSVVNSTRQEFRAESEWTVEGDKRWFRLLASPLKSHSAKGAMLLHLDITQQKETEKAQAESEERFQATFEQAGVGIAHVQQDGHFIRVNEKICHITGYTRKELLELNVGNLCHKEDLAHWHAILTALRSGKKNLNILEKRFRRKDGQVFWVNFVTTAVLGGDDLPRYFVCVFEDVTKQKQIEEKLWRQASRLAAVVEAQHELAGTQVGPKELMEKVAQMAHRLIESDGAIFERIEGDQIVLHSASGLAEANLGLRVDKESSFSGELIRQNQTICCNDTESDPFVDHEAARRIGIRSMVGTVLCVETVPVGVITVISRSVGRFGKSEINTLELLAQSLGTVLERKLAEQATRRRVREQAAVADLGRWALAGVRLSQLRDKAVEIVTEIFECEYCELLAYLPESQSFKLVAGVGWTPGLVGRLRIDGSVGSQALYSVQSESPVIFDDLDNEKRFSPSSLLRSHNVVSGISVIIPGEKGPWGLLGAHSSTRRTFSRDDVNFFQSVANVVAEATHRVQADEAIRLSETRYRRSSEQLAKIMNSSLDVICTFDYQGRFLQVSAACEQTWGYTAEELLGTACFDKVHLEDVLKTRQFFEDVIAGNPTRNFENRYVRKDGAVTHMTWSAHWSEVEQTMFCVARDNTEAKLAIEASRQLAQRLSTTLESITDGFYTVDRDWRFTYVNKEAERMLQRNRQDLLGRVVWDVFDHLRGSDLETQFRRAMAENCTVSFEEFYDWLNLWIEVRVYPSEDGLAIYFRDVSERKSTTDRLEEQAALLDKARDAILVRNLDNIITFWNKGAERLYGWSAEEVIGRSVSEILYRDVTPLKNACEEVVNKGEWSGELEQVTKDGRKIIIEARWTLVRDSAGRPKSILAINTDITEQKKLEQQFLRAQRMESIGTLAGGIAHDLNNVLTPITMAIDLLSMTVTDERSHQVLATIAASAKRGAEMVSQVLSFARGMEGRRIQVGVTGLIRDIERIARDTFPKNIGIRTNVAPSLWIMEGDPTQLEQVLLNFCLNARDAMPDGGHILISAENVMVDEDFAAKNIDAKPGPYLLIQVEDTGTGMPQSIIDKIFDPFFTTKELGKGTGLGLSTALAIVKSHEGFLRVFSELGVGSRFSVYFPAKLGSNGLLPDSTSVELPRGNGELILVVDDEPSVRDVARQTLEAFGYRVQVAVDGAEALMLYAKHKEEIAVVLTDMMMPVMGGATTIQVLTKMNPNVRIIAASGITSNEGVAKTAGPTVKQFLHKPYTAETVLKALKEVLSGET